MDRVEHTIDPVYDKYSRILILGSFPSVKSREGRFFYHHPQNRFWKVLAAITREPVPESIEQKKKFLLEHGIAVWDVIESCEIKGSSDSSITNVKSNHLSRILEEAPIEQIYVNGGKAYELYQKYCIAETGREVVKLPSTSPANAAKSLEMLIKEWEVISPYCKIPVPRLEKDIVKALLNWYDHNRRILPWRELSTPYRVWISEIMCQQTRIEAVKPYFDRFMEVLPTIEDLAHVEDEQLMKLWEGLGYYNRARNLKKAANEIMEQYQGELPADYEELLTISGIGEYTAGAIGSISYGLPVPAVDGNVLRVITRLTGSYADILKPAVKKNVMEILKEILPEKRVGDFNQALMELGAIICIPNGQPKCEECPWDTRCQAHKKDLTSVIPVKTPKKPRKIVNKTVFILNNGGKIALHKRPVKGLLAGLWEFPNVDGTLSLEEIREQLEKWNITDFIIQSVQEGKHIFSHVEWQMKGYHIDIKEKKVEEPWVWATKKEQKEAYAIPSAFEIFK